MASKVSLLLLLPQEAGAAAQPLLLGRCASFVTRILSVMGLVEVPMDRWGCFCLKGLLRSVVVCSFWGWGCQQRAVTQFTNQAQPTPGNCDFRFVIELAGLQ